MGPEDITQYLERWRQGDADAAGQILALVYADLRRIAQAYMRRERGDHTLRATALVHEAYIRLFHGAPVNLKSREDFFRAMAAHMRHHLVDYARRHDAAKRGGQSVRVGLDDVPEPAGQPQDEEAERDLQRLDRALERLADEHPRAAKVVELRFFANLSVEETASRLQISTGTVKRDFAFARAWLKVEMERVEPA